MGGGELWQLDELWRHGLPTDDGRHGAGLSQRVVDGYSGREVTVQRVGGDNRAGAAGARTTAIATGDCPRPVMSRTTHMVTASGLCSCSIAMSTAAEDFLPTGEHSHPEQS